MGEDRHGEGRILIAAILVRARARDAAHVGNGELGDLGDFMVEIILNVGAAGAGIDTTGIVPHQAL